MGDHGHEKCDDYDEDWDLEVLEKGRTRGVWDYNYNANREKFPDNERMFISKVPGLTKSERRAMNREAAAEMHSFVVDTPSAPRQEPVSGGKVTASSLKGMLQLAQHPAPPAENLTHQPLKRELVSKNVPALTTAIKEPYKHEWLSRKTPGESINLSKGLQNWKFQNQVPEEEQKQLHIPEFEESRPITRLEEATKVPSQSSKPVDLPKRSDVYGSREPPKRNRAKNSVRRKDNGPDISQEIIDLIRKRQAQYWAAITADSSSDDS